jgi:hypothetical protein
MTDTDATPRPHFNMSAPEVGRTTIDGVRRSCGGYQVYIVQSLGYDEAVIVDRGTPGVPEPVVLVNGPNYLRLRHPTLTVWEALQKWIEDRTIAPMVKKANERIDTAVSLGAMSQSDRMLTYQFGLFEDAARRASIAFSELAEASR